MKRLPDWANVPCGKVSERDIRREGKAFVQDAQGKGDGEGKRQNTTRQSFSQSCGPGSRACGKRSDVLRCSGLTPTVGPRIGPALLPT